MGLATMLQYHSKWMVRHWRPDKRGIYQLIWEDEAVDRNILHTTGENAILSAFFVTAFANYGAPPANTYLGLDHTRVPAEDDTLATLDELAFGDGYERKALITGGTGLAGQDWVLAASGGGYQDVTTKTVTWTATANWAQAVRNIFLATHVTAVVDGDNVHLICSLALSALRTLLNGDKLEGSMIIGLSE